MSTPSGSLTDRPLRIRVRFRGVLSVSWFAAFEDMQMSTLRAGDATETVLTGQVPDEAALIGIVNMLYQLGCPLVSVESQDFSLSAVAGEVRDP